MKHIHDYDLKVYFDDSTLEFLGMYADSKDLTLDATLRMIFYSAVTVTRAKYERELLDKANTKN